MLAMIANILEGIKMIDKQAPEFTTNAFHEEQVKQISLQDYQGRWVVLFFYPADFTFVCPTELGELADHYDVFKKLNTEVLSVSVDTEFVHKAWHDESPTIKKIEFPMLADPTHTICNLYGTLIESEGLSRRATFVIDPKGVIKAYEFHNNSIGRNVQELIRKIEAAQFVEKHGEVCPASWKPGAKTLKPGLNLVGKI
jgi:peroxiredoxin (alkyl hydroperoxide reductase subunit C)